MVESLAQAGDSELDAPAWEETQAEIQNGWLEPCEVSDLRVVHVAKRFPLQQGGKLRLIDDFSAAGVNQTVGMAEKLRVESVDELTATILVMLQKCGEGALLNLVGRTFDLKSAYKQFGVDVEHQKTLRIAQRHPGGGVKFFAVQSLPFGATASVSSFLRIAASIKFIGTVGLRLIWTNFFDDYTALCTRQTAQEVTFCVESLLRLLGVKYAETGPKAPDFAEKFKTLGLEFDLSETDHGSFVLGHTDKRREELLATLHEFLQVETVEVKALEKLHGRLVWFSSYVFGRELNTAVRVISRYARFKAKTINKPDDLNRALKFLTEELVRARPVQVSLSHSSTFLVFTDGAFEPTSNTPATIGGLLVDEWGRSLEFFGCLFHRPCWTNSWNIQNTQYMSLRSSQSWIAIRIWAKLLEKSHVVFYLDNTAAHSAFVRAEGATPAAAGMVRDFVKYEKLLGLLPWFGRVPSASNPADDASRLNFDVAWLTQAKLLSVVLPAHLSQWGISRGVPESCNRKA